MRVWLAEGEALTKARSRLAELWGDPVAMRGRAWRFGDCEVLVAGDFAGLAAFCLDEKPIAELVAIEAFAPRQGVGTSLLDALKARLAPDFAQLRLGTTNDNLDALRFYQSRGGRLAALRPGAVDAARRLKPSIPPVGYYGLPIRDEIDVVFDL